MTDAELITSFLRGQAPAFDALVGRWHARLYNFVLRYVGNREEAGDLCQLVFIQAYRQLDGLKSPDRFAAWLYRIAVNLCRDRQRQRQRRPTLYLEDLDSEGAGDRAETAMADSGPMPDRQASQREVHELLVVTCHSR